jgi:ABC-type sulfate/molybdate transport systems ATPase subunit
MTSESQNVPFQHIFSLRESSFAATIRGLHVTYDGSAVGNNHFCLRVEELDFTAGRIHSLYGTNGCGKTTLLRVLAGLVKPNGGLVEWRPSFPKAGADQVLVMSAGPMPHWTVRDNITRPMLVQGTGKDVANERCTMLIDLLGLKGYSNRYAHQLSAGQQQRTVLARALGLAPSILLLDEIMSAQSEYWSARIAEILRAYVDSGRVVVLVSHDPEWVRAYADRVTHLVSDSTDAVSTTHFFVGYDGSVRNWGEYRESRIREAHEQSTGN